MMRHHRLHVRGGPGTSSCFRSSPQLQGAQAIAVATSIVDSAGIVRVPSCSASPHTCAGVTGSLDDEEDSEVVPFHWLAIGLAVHSSRADRVRSGAVSTAGACVHPFRRGTATTAASGSRSCRATGWRSRLKRARWPYASAAGRTRGEDRARRPRARRRRHSVDFTRTCQARACR